MQKRGAWLEFVELGGGVTFRGTYPSLGSAGPRVYRVWEREEPGLVQRPILTTPSDLGGVSWR